MYTYKCYFHPKEDSADSCKGCKLPLCVGCQGWEGFCKDCIEKRRAVHQLKQLRTVAASKAHMASTTTGQLRLAIAQAGPPAARRGAAPLPPLSPTGSLRQGGAHSVSGMTRPLPGGAAPSRALPPEPAPQPRRAGLVDVSYKPAVDRTVASRPVAAPRPSAKARPAQPAAQAVVMPAWAMPFLAGLAVGVVFMIVMSLSHGHGHAKAKPLYQRLSHQERAVAQDLLGSATPPSVSLEGGDRPTDGTATVGWTGR